MVSYKPILIATAILVSSLLLSSSITNTEKHQAFARCPNGTHKSPSGDCESVASSSPSSSEDNESVTSSERTSTTSRSQRENNNNPSLPPTTPTATTTNSTSGEQCDQSLWNHIYNPSRLQVVDPCKTVSGIIESKRVEADGDYHIRLKLDPQFANLVNAANVKGQFGDLVLEPICMNRVTQLDAISACQNFHQNIDIPAVGSHVQVTGSYVLDKEHGKWAEIHPVTSITKIP